MDISEEAPLETDQSSLNIHWAFGFSKDLLGSVQSLCSKDRNALLFLSGHSGVVYDFEHRKQTILQGHCNIITCCAVDRTKRWIVTADAGLESIMVVWDALSFLPVKTFLSPHSHGVRALDFSADGLYIASLSAVPAGMPVDQQLCVWRWTTGEDAPLQTTTVSPPGLLFHSVRFNPDNIHQLVTTSDAAVHFWDWTHLVLESYCGRVSKTDIGNFSGEFTATVFLPETEIALSATSQGYVIVWENRSDTRKDAQNQAVSVSLKVAVKVVKLLECPISLLDVSPNKYLVLGCGDGAVRFYDYFLRLEAWFEDLHCGPVTSISFSVQACPYSPLEAGQPGLKFWTPDFLVGTKKSFIVGVESSLFDEIKKEDRRGTLLMQGLHDAVVSVACHPRLPLVAFLCKTGTLQLWNYEMKLLMNVREFSTSSMSHTSQFGEKTTAHKAHVQARDIAFHPSGSLVLVAFSSGIIKALNAETLQDIQNFAPSSDSVEKLKFSFSGNFFAAIDEQHHVLLFKREGNLDDASAKNAFTYIGRTKAHREKVVGIEFGTRDNVETLISVSEDRYAVEYDLSASSVTTGLLPVKSRTTENAQYCQHRIEMLAKPTCMLWHPKQKDDVEDRFITINSEFKIKEYNVESKQCRKTVLAPRFGYPPKSLLLVPQSERIFNYRAGDPPRDLSQWQAAYVFATPMRVIGVGQFPLDGNPMKSVGIVAHAGEISGFAVSFDGQFAFSAGGSDLTVNMWNVKIAEPSMEDVSNSLAPFLALLEGGGQNGELHQSFIDYFYYCQLRQGGEDTMETRELKGVIPLEELPALVRAVGYYPSEDEVQNMINEVRYKDFMATGETQDTVGLDEAIRLYVNHRPVIPLERHLIQSAINVISSITKERDAGVVSWTKLREILTTEGEVLEESDLNDFLGALIGDVQTHLDPSDLIDGRTFATKILGFEEMY